jgi:hypothetical protein
VENYAGVGLAADNILGCLHIACWITKAPPPTHTHTHTHTHKICVIHVAFQLQQVFVHILPVFYIANFKFCVIFDEDKSIFSVFV